MRLGMQNAAARANKERADKLPEFAKHASNVRRGTQNLIDRRSIDICERIQTSLRYQQL